MVPKHANWAVALLDDERQRFLKPHVEQGTSLKDWGTGATHHKISKDSLEVLGRALDVAMNPQPKRTAKQRPDPEAAAAAKEFWKAAQDSAGREILEQAGGSVIKTLWNLPVNLEVGPALILENPGASFDPNTDPSPAGDGKRILSTESEILQKIEKLYLPKLTGARPQPLTADDWKTLTALLRQAQVAFEKDRDSGPSGKGRGGIGYLAMPRSEQWIKGETKITTKAEGEKTVPAYQRKRLRYFPGAAQAKKWYRTRQTPTLDPSAEFAVLNQAFPLTASYNLLDREGNKHTVKITLSGTALAHMCQRHCYTYFTWAKGDIKLVNNFWPTSKVVDVGQYFAIVSGALPDIAQAGLDHILAEFDEQEQNRGGTITVVNVSHSRETLFFMAKFTKNPEASDEEESVDNASAEDPSGDGEGEITMWALDLSTVAPDGTSAESYPTKELTDAKIP